MPSPPNLMAVRASSGRIGVDANAEFAEGIRPAHQRAEFARHRRLDHRHPPRQHLAQRSVDGDDVAGLEGARADAHGAAAVIDPDGAAAGDAGLAHAARDHRGVRGHAAARGQNAFGRVHAVNVFRAGLDPHQDDLAAIGLQFGGLIGGEHDFAGGSTRRRRQAGGDHVAGRGGIDGRMQQLIERSGIDPRHRVLFGDHAFIGEFDGDAQRRLRGALAAAGLQHPQLALLDREFHVLHVAVMLFEHRVDPRQFLERLGHRGFHRGLVGAGFLARIFGDVLRRANARHHVLALRVDQEFAVQLALAGRGIARERNAGRRGLAHIAEHHGLHVDRGAPGFRNVVQPPVGHRARVHPGGKHRADRAPQLGVRILREISAGFARHRILVAADQIDPVVAGEVGVERIALAVLEGIENVLEVMMLEAEHHIGIHRDEAAVAVIGKAAIARHFGQRLDRPVVEAEIEHGIHHAGHRGAAAGTHRNQQRIFGVAEGLAGQPADMLQRLFDLRLQLLRIGFVVRVEISADRGRNGEAGRHRQAQIGHLGEIGALAAQQIAQARFALGLAVAKGEHPFAGFRSLRSGLGCDRAAGGLRGRLGRALFDRLAGAGRRRGLGPGRHRRL